MTDAAHLRRTIVRSRGGDRRNRERRISRKEVVSLLLLTDDALARAHRTVTADDARGRTCAELAAELRGVCGYGHVKALLRILHLLVRHPRPGLHAAVQPRDRTGRFLPVLDLGDVADHEEGLIRRWISAGVDEKTARRWAVEMGGGDGRERGLA